jgi:crossover junction endodeoxyribonuclease RuvC
LPVQESVVGIDPGIAGAVCYFGPAAVEVIDIPVVGAQSELNAAALRDWLTEHQPHHAFVELVNAMPSVAGMDGHRRGMGAVSAFRFGAMFGAIKATLSCTRVAFTLVTPTTWKRFYGLIRADKEQSRLSALQLHPELAAKLARRKDVGHAEALLTARFGARELIALPRADDGGGAP